jgi:hypothetical protein
LTFSSNLFGAASRNANHGAFRGARNDSAREEKDKTVMMGNFMIHGVCVMRDFFVTDSMFIMFTECENAETTDIKRGGNENELT